MSITPISNLSFKSSNLRKDNIQKNNDLEFLKPYINDDVKKVKLSDLKYRTEQEQQKKLLIGAIAVISVALGITVAIKKGLFNKLFELFSKQKETPKPKVQPELKQPQIKPDTKLTSEQTTQTKVIEPKLLPAPKSTEQAIEPKLLPTPKEIASTSEPKLLPSPIEKNEQITSEPVKIIEQSAPTQKTYYVEELTKTEIFDANFSIVERAIDIYSQIYIVKSRVEQKIQKYIKGTFDKKDIYTKFKELSAKEVKMLEINNHGLPTRTTVFDKQTGKIKSIEVYHNAPNVTNRIEYGPNNTLTYYSNYKDNGKIKTADSESFYSQGKLRTFIRDFSKKPNEAPEFSKMITYFENEKVACIVK